MLFVLLPLDFIWSIIWFLFANRICRFTFRRVFLKAVQENRSFVFLVIFLYLSLIFVNSLLSSVTQLFGFPLTLMIFTGAYAHPKCQWNKKCLRFARNKATLHVWQGFVWLKACSLILMSCSAPILQFRTDVRRDLVDSFPYVLIHFPFCGITLASFYSQYTVL